MPSSSIAPALVGPQRLAGLDLPGLFAGLPDPRGPRGKRRLVAVALAVVLGVALAGAWSCAAIGRWVREAGLRTAGPLDWPERLSEASAVRRVLAWIDADLFGDLLGAWAWLRVRSDPRKRTVISFGGKTARGAKAGGGTASRLLAGLVCGAGTVVAPTAVDAKTDEISCLQNLLKRLAVGGCLIVAGALRGQTAAGWAVLQRGADCLPTVKRGQPKLRQACAGLPWRQVPAAWSAGRGRGRRRVWSIRVAAAGCWAGFSGVQQIAQLVRQTVRGGEKTTDTVCLLCFLPVWRASPEQIAVWAQGRWAVESPRRIRDAVYGEDQSTVSAGFGPQTMATLRNLAVGLLRLSGRDGVAAWLRHHAWHPEDIPKLLLTSPEKTLP
ncbi:MAG: ISAs1 family transposase [Propionibacteriaceae bacterium]|jgi:hypothetical protein|nr:ISAs1 family transposase [Propionibacteriaceae bacterium]